jgi:lysylphosphatidylglycerol synthetase-like protein (DUF2156 family)
MCSLVRLWMKKTFLLLYVFSCVTLNEEDFLIVLCVLLFDSEWRRLSYCSMCSLVWLWMMKTFLLLYENNKKVFFIQTDTREHMKQQECHLHWNWHKRLHTTNNNKEIFFIQTDTSIEGPMWLNVLGRWI